MHKTLYALAAVGLLALSGCGDAPPVAPVVGKVTLGGRPLTAGRVMFSPLEGEEGAIPAMGDIQPDGRYSLSTYGDQDGAAVGKHQVMVIPPRVEGGQEDQEDDDLDDAPAPYVVPPGLTFEVQAGRDNEFHIELQPRRR